MTEKMTYAQSGVDIHLEEKAIKALAAGITYKRTGLGAPLTDIGHYAGLIEFGEYALGLATDGDADRFAAVDADGRVLSETEAAALLVDHLARSGRARRGVAISRSRR